MSKCCCCSPNCSNSSSLSLTPSELSSFKVSATSLIGIMSRVASYLQNAIVPGVSTQTLIESIQTAINELSNAIGITPPADCPTLNSSDLTAVVTSLHGVISALNDVTTLVAQTNQLEVQELANNINALINLSNSVTPQEVNILVSNLITSLHKVIYRINQTTEALTNMNMNEIQVLANAINTLIHANPTA